MTIISYCEPMDPVLTQEIHETALKKADKALLAYFGKSPEAFVKVSISSVVTEADLASMKPCYKLLISSHKTKSIS